MNSYSNCLKSSDACKMISIDCDIVVLIRDFSKNVEYKGITVEMIGFIDKTPLNQLKRMKPYWGMQ